MCVQSCVRRTFALSMYIPLVLYQDLVLCLPLPGKGVQYYTYVVHYKSSQSLLSHQITSTVPSSRYLDYLVPSRVLTYTTVVGSTVEYQYMIVYIMCVL